MVDDSFGGACSTVDVEQAAGTTHRMGDIKVSTKGDMTVSGTHAPASAHASLWKTS